MRSHSLIIAVAALSIPLALTGLSDQTAKASGPQVNESPATELEHPVDWQLSQSALQNDATAGFSNTVHGRALEAAPVPDSLGGSVAPADRVATPRTVANGAGPDDSTPFSGAPDAQRSTNDPTTSHTSPDGHRPLTPNLGP